MTPSINCEALKKYIDNLDPSLYNVSSSMLISFIECFHECLTNIQKCRNWETEYISYFSRYVLEVIKNKYDCSNPSVNRLLNNASRYIDRVIESSKDLFGIAFKMYGELRSRLAIHIRSPYMPLDIGISWDPYMNLPYIPSTSLKGLVKSYFKEYKPQITDIWSVGELFGEPEEKGHAGLIIFYDAYPVKCRGHLIELDIITPHYREINGAIEEVFVKPTPLIFPTVAPNTVFNIPITINTGIIEEIKSPSERHNLVNTLDSIILEIAAAIENGIGAKTSIGYGYMKILHHHRYRKS